VLVKRVLSDSELADSLALMKVSGWAQFEDSLTDLKSNRLYLLGNFGAALKTLAESNIRFAVQIFKVASPLIL
jgi:hypothetical protein